MCGGSSGSIEGEPSASCGPARHPTTLMQRPISRCCCNGKCRIGEAWYNLADLLDDQGRSQAAIECLRKALLVAPNTVANSLRLREARRSARPCLRMGDAGSAVAEVLRDPSERTRLFRGVSCRFRSGGLITPHERALNCDGVLFGPMW